MSADSAVAVVMAGGQGSRLHPLTDLRAKPDVRIGGIWRIIDFTLSNCINSGIRKILVLTQYKSDSLNEHLARAWSFLPSEIGEFVWNMPAQMRTGPDWYRGTADAVWQNLWKLESLRPGRVLILSADHVYKMDYRRLMAFHDELQSDVVIAAHPVPRADSRHFGVLSIDDRHRVREFVEKSPHAPEMPQRPGCCLANMGIYSFRTDLLFDVLREFPGSGNGADFGHDVLPALVQRGDAVHAWPFAAECPDSQQPPYWRDVGTIDALFEANMDLVSVSPELDLYEERWPVRALHQNLPPARCVHGPDGRRSEVLDSLVSAGCTVCGARVVRSLLSPRVRVETGAQVERSVLMDNVRVGPGARIRNTIVDEGVQIPAGTTIGHDPDQDRARGLPVTRQGITVVDHHFDPERILEQGPPTPARQRQPARATTPA